MILDMHVEITNLLKEADINPGSSFARVIDEISAIGLISNTSIMYEINKQLFLNKKMLARKFYQHAMYESMGGELIDAFAGKFAVGKLQEDMKLQAKDEVKHGKMLEYLIRYTDIAIEDIQDTNNSEEDELPDFKDDIKTFVCFIHAAEIRTMVMLHQYLHILNKLNDSSLNKMIMMLEHIKEDEIKHAAYTGKYINEWLMEDEALETTLVNCFHYTNKESWQEISNMSSCFASELIRT